MNSNLAAEPINTLMTSATGIDGPQMEPYTGCSRYWVVQVEEERVGSRDRPLSEIPGREAEDSAQWPSH